jgi:hypothetical protein
MLVTAGGCTIPYLVYIRNKSALPAVIDVHLLDKSRMRTLPNSALVAGKIVTFKAGFRQSFADRQYVHWIDTAWFSFTVLPGTTIDFTDLAGRFVNAHPRETVFVTITAGTTIDTLNNGRDDFRYKKFGYKNVGISLPVYYYDINL